LKSNILILITFLDTCTIILRDCNKEIKSLFSLFTPVSLTYNFFRIGYGETFAFGTLFNGKDDTGVGVDMAKSVVRVGCISA